MSPAPTVPDEAKKYVNRGVAAGEEARAENDYKDAIAEFQKAVNLAPWLGAGYRGLAVMQDKVGLYSQALQNLKLFLLTNPQQPDAEAAKTLRDKIEYRQEKAQKAALQKTAEEKATASLSSLSGIWRASFLNTGTYSRPHISSDWGISSTSMEVSVNDNNFEAIMINRGKRDYLYRGTIYGDKIIGTFYEYDAAGFLRASCGITNPPSSPLEGEISQDRNTILLVVHGAQLLKGGDCKYDPERYFKSVKLER